MLPNLSARRSSRVPGSDAVTVSHVQLKAGKRVRVTHTQDMLNFSGGPVDYPAGECVQGVVELVERDGFFQLNTDCGEIRGYFIHDPTLKVEELLN